MATQGNVIPADFTGGFIGRGTPAAHSAERAVLSSMICNSQSLAAAAERLSPEDFDDPRHRTLFEVLRRLHLIERKAVDPNLLAEALRDRVEEVGGVEYLVATAQFAPALVHLDPYVEMLQEKALLRRLISVGTEMVKMAQEGTDVKESLAKAESLVMSLSQQFVKGEYRALTEVVDQVWAQVAEFKENPGELRGQPTGFEYLDKMLGGLRGGDLMILAARPAMGKTALALNIAQNVAAAGKAVLIFSLEMGANQLAFRMLCSEAYLDNQRVQSGRFNEAEFEQLINSLNRLCTLPLYIDDSPSSTPYDVASKARRLIMKEASENGLGLVVVDYLTLLKPNTSFDNMNQQVSEISRQMKAVARELNVPMLVLSQLNRELEKTKDKRPQLSHLRDSGAIEQDADIVMFLHRPDYFDTSGGGEDGQDMEATSNIVDADLIIAKHRNGPTGAVKLKFHKDRVKFVSVQWSSPED